MLNFDFSKTTPAGDGSRLTDGYYATTITKIVAKPGKEGSVNINFEATVNAGEVDNTGRPVSGKVYKTLRVPNGSPDDGVLSFWLALFMSAFNRSEEDIKKIALNNINPQQAFMGKTMHVCYRADVGVYVDPKTGEEKASSETRVIPPEVYREGKASKAANPDKPKEATTAHQTRTANAGAGAGGSGGAMDATDALLAAMGGGGGGGGAGAGGNNGVVTGGGGGTVGVDDLLAQLNG